MDKPLYEIYRNLYPSYVKKTKPVLVKGNCWHSAVILIASIVGVAIICLFSSCGLKPCRADMVDLNIIAKIESSNNPLAYNYKSQARGLCQITPICLKEFTQLNNYWYSDPDYLFNPAFNLKVADWYMNTRIPQMLKHYRIADTLENRLFAYNAGIGNVVKGIKPRETRNYIKKYHKLEKS